MSDSLVLAVARYHVQAYVDASAELAQQHDGATDCRACEEFLQKGIDAYKWLRRADETLREADYRGLMAITSEVRETLESLYSAWREAGAVAERRLDALESPGCRPANADQFRTACDEIHEILARNEWQSLASRARVLSASQEPW